MSNVEGEPKKGMSGCLIAAIIVGAFGVVVVVGVSITIGVLARSAPAKGMMATMNAAATSMTGPAPDAMRAIGCEMPTSMDVSGMASVVRTLAKNDPEAQKGIAELDGMFAARCYSDTLTCEQVFTAWNKAAPTNATHVGIEVVASDHVKQRCAKHFDRSGRELPPMTISTTPTAR